MCFKDIWNFITSHAEPDINNPNSESDYQIASIILKKQKLMDYRQKKKRPEVFNSLKTSSWLYIETLMLPFILNVFQHQKSTCGTTLQNMNYFYENNRFITVPNDWDHQVSNVVIDKSAAKTYNYNRLEKAELKLDDIKRSLNNPTQEEICDILLQTLPKAVFDDIETDIYANAYCFFYQNHKFELKHRIDRNNKNMSKNENYEWLYDFLIVNDNKKAFSSNDAYFVSKLNKHHTNSFKYYKIRDLLTLVSPKLYLSDNDYSIILDKISQSCNLKPTNEHFLETMKKINILSKK